MDGTIKYCPVCNAIALHWDKKTKEWTAPYADGGCYCTCSDEEIASRACQI